MDWKDVGEKIVDIAPELGKALISFIPGAAPAIAAATAVCKVFNVPEKHPVDSPEAISNVLGHLQVDNDWKYKVMTASNDFNLAMRKIDVEELKMTLEDKQNARGRDSVFIQQGRENWRANIMLIAAFVAVIIITIILAYYTEISEIVIGFLTTIGGMFARNIGTAFDFEFGSSRSSMDKTITLERFMKK